MLALVAAAMSVPSLSLVEWLGLAGFILTWVVVAGVAIVLMRNGVSERTRLYQDSSINALHEENESLMRRMDVVERGHETLKEDVAQRDAKIFALTARVNELEAQVASLRTQLNEKDAEVARLKSENVALHAEIDDLKARLAGAEAALATAQEDLRKAATSHP